MEDKPDGGLTIVAYTATSCTIGDANWQMENQFTVSQIILIVLSVCDRMQMQLKAQGCKSHIKRPFYIARYYGSYGYYG